MAYGAQEDAMHCTYDAPMHAMKVNSSIHYQSAMANFMPQTLYPWDERPPIPN